MKTPLPLIAALLCAAPVSAALTTPDTATAPDTAAVAHAPAVQSDDASYEMQFLPSVIPPTPQAAALARYGEYPVSHTTGIPDITIPLYEIDLGGYKLPITISYHASGIKYDDVATPVGLGWTLNAGGAISRLIQGAPDFEHSEVNDTTYRNINKVKDLINKNSNIELLKRILCDYEYTEWDTESDRYTYNYPGETGLFRYSHADKKFVSLGYSLAKIERAGTKQNSYFKIQDTSGIIYYFKWHECTGIANDERYVYTTAWYLTEIHTPHGIIELDYTGGESQSTEHSFGMMKYVDVTYSGNKPDGTPHTSTLTQGIPVTFKPALLKSIKWAGGTIELNYENDRKDICPDRLSSIAVMDPDKNVRKEIFFDNDRYWGSTNKRETCRMLLNEIHDTENGKYTFGYATGISPVPYGSKKCRWDYWGYPNGNNSVYGTSKEIARKIMQQVESAAGINKYIAQYANRLSEIRNMSSGVLTSITHPTGGTTRFTYETNTWYRNGTLENVGGLRIRSITNDSVEKVYTYETPQVNYDPLRFSTYQGTRMYTQPYSTTFREVYVGVSEPMTPGFVSSTVPAFYKKVIETLSDCSYTEYSYSDDVLMSRPGIYDEWAHPSTLEVSCLDNLDISPLLEFKKVYSADRQLCYSEEYLYDNTETMSFLTGVKIVNKLIEWPLGDDADSPFATVVSGHTDNSCIGYTTTSAISTFKRVRRIVYNDYIAGTSVATDFNYDRLLRSVKPRSVVYTNSDGKRDSTAFEFPFDRNGTIYSDMAEFMPDVIVGKRTFRDGVQATAISAEYDNSLWHRPVAVSTSVGDGKMWEKYRIIAHGPGGKPATIVTNQSDTTRYEWDDSGCYLLKLIEPGNLVTRYTHKPLFGVDTITYPRGYQVQYHYKSSYLSIDPRINEGKLTMIKDHRGMISVFGYNTVNGGDSLAGNFIRETTRLRPFGSGATSKTRFFDGFGRATMTVLDGISPTNRYIHSLTTYDKAGRAKDNWLPAVASQLSDTLTLSGFKDMSFDTYFDADAYSSTYYDALGREKFVQTPGEIWHQKNKGKSIRHHTNSGTPKVKRYRAPVENTSLVQDGYYPDGSLLCETTTDEDGRSVSIFTDLSGKKILERRGEGNDTYFIYNDWGQVRYVLSPEYQKSGYKAKYAYEYRYDSRGNMVKKILPGCEYTQYWYDRADRMTFMQDATLRENGLYRFFLYDAAGRPVLQGTCHSCVRDGTVNRATFSKENTGFMSTGYILGDDSRLTSPTIEKVNYYDRYLDNNVTSNALKPANPRGLLTKTIHYLNDDTPLATRYYYDLLGNVIYKRTDEIDGITSGLLTEYSFSGKPVKTTFVHNGIRLITENKYEPKSDLLIETMLSIEKGGKTYNRPSIKYEYDDFGQPVKIIRPATVGDITVNYNIHGNMTSLTSKSFSQRLHYADGPGTPLYNGDISSVKWKSPDHYRWRGYKLIYNALGWLKNARYGENESLTTDADHYTVDILDYSENGAIKRLQRHGLKDDGKYGKIDNLHLRYDGNRLVEVEEDANPVTREDATDFNHTATSNPHFTYNGVGALTSDRNRGIWNILYDDLNHPVRMTFDGFTRFIDFVYNPDGTNLRTVFTYSRILPSGNLPPDAIPSAFISKDTVDYCGPVVYENGEVRQILFDGGYATFSADGTPEWHYFTRDHVGNVRTVTRNDGTVEQINHYYPFGTTFANAGKGADVQPYRHAGKEFYAMFGLHWSDFGARFYSPQLSSWTSMDPLCEKYHHLSPYSFCANNPFRIIDPDGKKLVIVIDNEYHEITYSNNGYSCSLGESDYSNFAVMVEEALACLSMGPNGFMLVNWLISVPNTIYIKQSENRNRFIHAEHTIYWNYHKAEIGLSPLSPGGYYRPNIPFFIPLGHEMFHAYDFLNGTLLDVLWPGSNVFISEYMACIYENLIRAEHGLPLRSHYGVVGIDGGSFPLDPGVPKLF